MSNDAELIVKAIEGLQTNIIKDYILPVSSVLISGLLGGGVAYYSIDRQESTKIEIEKIKTLNETLLTGTQMRMSLISIKLNYSEVLDSNPISRIFAVPPLQISEQEANIDFASLSFIAPNQNATDFDKWSSIGYISTIFSNYNALLDVWKKRNEMIEELMPIVKPHWGKPLNREMLDGLIGAGNLALLSDLTERAIHMTDDVLIEICAFIIGFGELAKTKVKKRVLKKFGNILEVTLPNNNDFPKAVDVISKVAEVDYQLLAELQSRAKTEVLERYKPIYT